MAIVSQEAADDKYLEIILNRIRVCKEYKPAFGQDQKVTLTEFQQLYGSDPFYAREILFGNG